MSDDARDRNAKNRNTRERNTKDRKALESARNGLGGADAGPSPPFVLYVEGARDREILACWARRVDHDLARAIERHSVILGGRRPARAMADFQKRGGAAAGLKGLVVLDRDDHTEISTSPPAISPATPPATPPGSPVNEVSRESDTRPSRVHGSDLAGPGLDRANPDESVMRGSETASSIEREDGLEVFVWSRRHIESYLLVPAALRRLVGLDSDDRRIERFVDDAEHGPDALHAKRILGTGGSLSAVLGAELRAGEIARAMRSDEFHEDIFDLFERIGRAVGLSQTGPEVIVRSRTTP